MILTSDEGYFEKIGGFMSWKMKCMDNQEKPCEYTLSEAEMFAFLGKKTDPADNLTGKVLHESTVCFYCKS